MAGATAGNDKGLEKRRAQRVRTLKAGKIIFNRGASVLDCTVRDISSGGARLEVGQPVRTPGDFVLEFTVGGEVRRYPCAITWRRKSEVGVIFT
jgi:PilZ domain